MSSAFTSGRLLEGVTDLRPGDADGTGSGVEDTAGLAWEQVGFLWEGDAVAQTGGDIDAVLVGVWVTPGTTLSRKLTTDKILIPISSSSVAAVVISLPSAPVSVSEVSAFSSLQTVS